MSARYPFIGNVICVPHPAEGRCEALVYERNTYRYTGRTRSGFEMHYNERQCKRKVRSGQRLCAQHSPGKPVVSSVSRGKS